MIINSEGYRIITGEDSKNRRQVIRRFTDILLQSGFEEVMITGTSMEYRYPPNMETICEVFKDKVNVKLFTVSEEFIDSSVHGTVLQVFILNPEGNVHEEELRNMALFLPGMVDDGFYLDEMDNIVNSKPGINDEYGGLSPIGFELNIDRICELIK